jgi:hypothetical protein
MNKRNPSVLFNPIFIISLLLLILNDNYFKYEYHNWLTGKLSDFAGLIVFPVFLSYLFPKHSKWWCLISGIFFFIWKTPLSNEIIKLVNSNGLFRFGRVIDYTDFVAFLSLPLANWIITHKNDRVIKANVYLKYSTLFVAFISLCSTSYIRPCSVPQGTIYIGKSYKLKTPKDSVLNRINALGFKAKVDSTKKKSEFTDGNYFIENIVVPTPYLHYCNDFDTIEKLTFSFTDVYGEKHLLIKEITFSDTLHLTNWKAMKNYSKLYKDITKDLFARQSTKK